MYISNFSTSQPHTTHSHKRNWTYDEDLKLRHAFEKYGENWSLIATELADRNPKQCRERYLFHLRDGINSSDFTTEEDRILLSLVAQHGPRWSQFVQHFNGRTSSQIKNRYAFLERPKNLDKKLKASVPFNTFPFMNQNPYPNSNDSASYSLSSQSSIS